MKPVFRFFQIEYNNAKLKTANPQTRQLFQQRHLLYGVVWPPTDYNLAGGVSLSNSVSFRSVHDCIEHFSESGHYVLTWLDTGEQEENTPVGETIVEPKKKLASRKLLRK